MQIQATDKSYSTVTILNCVLRVVLMVQRKPFYTAEYGTHANHKPPAKIFSGIPNLYFVLRHKFHAKDK